MECRLAPVTAAGIAGPLPLAGSVTALIHLSVNRDEGASREVVVRDGGGKVVIGGVIETAVLVVTARPRSVIPAVTPDRTRCCDSADPESQ